MSRNSSWALLLALACLAAPACRTSQPARYYLLSADIAADPASATRAQPAVGIGPIAFPQYLDRPQMVTREGSSELEISELHRWAEPLESNFLSVLADNLTARLGSDRVYGFPWPARRSIDRRVTGEVARFDVDETGRAVLEVRWQVTDGEGEAVVPTRRSRYTQTSAAGDHAAMVSALAATVAAFATEVAGAVEGTRTGDA